MQHIVFSVVEAQAVPRRVLMAVTWVEILVWVASEAAEPLDLILCSVAVDDIHDDGDTHAMRGIYELFQIFWRSESGAWREEGRDVVAEAAVVRVLLYRHDLYAVIAVTLDAWENVLAEFIVCADLLCVACHADMAFIDEERIFVCMKMLMLPLI